MVSIKGSVFLGDFSTDKDGIVFGILTALSLVKMRSSMTTKSSAFYEEWFASFKNILLPVLIAKAVPLSELVSLDNPSPIASGPACDFL